MWMLPASLRARVAASLLLGIFLIPVTASSLRGLTHVLTCSDEVAATLTVDTSTTGDGAVLGSADTTTRDRGADPGPGPDGDALCGGLVAELDLATTSADRAEVTASVTNETPDDWKGTIELRFEGTTIPVSIGRIGSGETETDTIELRVRPGRVYEISATLLIGV